VRTRGEKGGYLYGPITFILKERRAIATNYRDDKKLETAGLQFLKNPNGADREKEKKKLRDS